MEIKIKEEKHNPLLGRREVWFEVEHKGKPTPRKIEVAELLAAKLNAKLDLMVIRHYATMFGTNKSRGLCLIYDDEEHMKAAEPLKKLSEKKRIGKKEGEKNEAQAEQEMGEVQSGGK